MKFEVGKKYREIHRKMYEYKCVFMNDKAVILEVPETRYLFSEPADSTAWEEVPPPLTFGDLKVGEKFKWKGNSDKEAMINGQLSNGERLYVYLKTGQAFLIKTVEANLRLEVERVS